MVLGAGSLHAILELLYVVSPVGPAWVSPTAWRSHNCQAACLAAPQENKMEAFGIFMTQPRK